MRHDLVGEDFHVVDLAVEIAGFRAQPKPRRARVSEFADALDPIGDVSSQGEPFQSISGKSEFGHSLRVTPGLEHVVVQLVAFDIFGDLRPELTRYILTLETKPHRVVEDRGDGRMDSIDGLVPVGIER